ncbi:MAG: glycolate oxidase subunit GlcD, partial [Deltaproteobacteria bacterium]|nr:glycolate oxidase subunit GlcD [Deltaproteobacteria bacterium]
PETLEREVSHIERVLNESHARNILVAEDAAQAEKIWLARRAAGPAVFRMKPDVITEDVTVPVAQFTTMMKKAVDICAKNCVTVGILAHAGDGNLHPCILFDKRDVEEFKRVETTLGEMAQAALDIGGTLSGEHGIGIAKAPFLRLELNEAARRVTRDLKRCFDPKGILNPGKFVEGC